VKGFHATIRIANGDKIQHFVWRPEESFDRRLNHLQGDQYIL